MNCFKRATENNKLRRLYRILIMPTAEIDISNPVKAREFDYFNCEKCTGNKEEFVSTIGTRIKTMYGDID